MERLNISALRAVILIMAILVVAAANYFRRETEASRYWGDEKNYSVVKVRDALTERDVYQVKLPSGNQTGFFVDSLSAVKFIPELVRMNIKSGIAR